MCGRRRLWEKMAGPDDRISCPIGRCALPRINGISHRPVGQRTLDPRVCEDGAGETIRMASGPRNRHSTNQ
jgi:hypothetical protein